MTGVFRKAVFFVILLCVTAIGYQYMIKKANRELAKAKVQLQAILGKLAEFEKASAAAEGLAKQMEQLEESIIFFESKLPPTSEIHKVLEQVTVIAQDQGLKPKTIRTLAKKNNSGYVEQPITMGLEGNFNAFYSFLLELEKQPRIMKIRELKLAKHLKDEGQIKADFVVSIFFQNKKTEQIVNG